VRAEVVNGPGVRRIGAAVLIRVSSGKRWDEVMGRTLQFAASSIKLFIVMPAISESYS
jgi:hypothetical protein